MSTEHNPLGREYADREWAAAKRQGVTVTINASYDLALQGVKTVPGGPLLYATGAWWPEHARQQATNARKAAADWDLVADAMDREWKKEAK